MALLSRERYGEVDIIVCDATPEGDIAAPVGSMALSTEGVLYTKGSGVGNTGWRIAQDKAYWAKLSQTGTSDPVVTEIRNTYGSTPLWAYDEVGGYVLVLTGIVGATSAASICNGGAGATSAGFVHVTLVDDSAKVITLDRSTGAQADDILFSAIIMITTPAQ